VLWEGGKGYREGWFKYGSREEKEVFDLGVYRASSFNKWFKIRFEGLYIGI
jgi:hypothetical protein